MSMDNQVYSELTKDAIMDYDNCNTTREHHIQITLSIVHQLEKLEKFSLPAAVIILMNSLCNNYPLSPKIGVKTDFGIILNEMFIIAILNNYADVPDMLLEEDINLFSGRLESTNTIRNRMFHEHQYEDYLKKFMLLRELTMLDTSCHIFKMYFE